MVTQSTDTIRDTAERFARDVTEHQLKVLHQDGLYRHLRFSQPGSSFYWFDLVTWPGKLAITGDMGGQIFSRVEDMFEFFRAKSGWNSGSINPQYWAEKIVSGAEGVRQYSEDKFRQVVLEHVEDAEEEYPGLTVAVREALTDDDADITFEDGARQWLNDFRFPGSVPDAFVFLDTWEWNFSDWDFHYLWRCNAIQWGINRYDAARAVESLRSSAGGTQ